MNDVLIEMWCSQHDHLIVERFGKDERNVRTSIIIKSCVYKSFRRVQLCILNKFHNSILLIDIVVLSFDVLNRCINFIYRQFQSYLNSLYRDKLLLLLSKQWSAKSSQILTKNKLITLNLHRKGNGVWTKNITGNYAHIRSMWIILK